MSRTVISGPVKHGETLREAPIRNVEKDVGPVTLPAIPLSLIPFHVAEYSPFPPIFIPTIIVNTVRPRSTSFP